MRRLILWTTVLSALFFIQKAHARNVYLNGVDISNIRDQTFTKATVKIDAQGNIYITAPGYKVEIRDPKPQEQAPETTKPDTGGPNSSLSNRYYLVTEPSPQGRAQYDFSILVNGVEKKTIPAGSPQQIIEISAWLHPGDNEVVIRGVKNLQGGRKSSSSSDKVRILVGLGHEQGKTVKIDKVLASVKADAGKLSTIQKPFLITAK